jgi:uncharacterized alpha-E superfamily protein
LFFTFLFPLFSFLSPLEVHVLSRVAESLFWIGRYIERAENAARLLDVNYYATLEGSGLVSEQWGPLLTITGSEVAFREHNTRADGRSVPYWLAFSTDNHSSIKSCLEQARENARSLRDRLSTEMWEALNRSYHDLCFGTERILERDELHSYCVAVRDASHLFHGIAAATLLHDPGWDFLRAGQMLERGDNVLRLLQVRYRRKGPEAAVADALENHRWMAVLKSASAYEAYRRRYHTSLELRRIVEFLVLEPRFPRSVRYSAGRLQNALASIAKVSGAQPEMIRRVGWLVAQLEYASVDSILDAETPSLERLLEEFNAVGAGVFEAYFNV